MNLKHKPIYLDYQSTTPVDSRVLEEMLPFFSESFGNPASQIHCYGLKAEDAVEKARERVARLLRADRSEIIFTSGATESNNLAIRGVAEIYREKGNHLITSVAEHKSVLETMKYLEGKDFEVTYLPVDSMGRVQIEEVEKAITPQTILISIMTANNEVGTYSPIEAIGKLSREREVFFHTDAAQSLGKSLLNVQAGGIDLLSLSGHKIYAPKGIGALYVRSQNPRVRIAPLIYGGGQEKGLRSGTLNVPGIVGLGKAVEIAGELMEEESQRIRQLQNQLYKRLSHALEEIYLNGDPNEGVPGNLNLSFAYVEAENLIEQIGEKVACSLGSACSSKEGEPSYVLSAMGISGDLIASSIRFSLGRNTTEEEVVAVSDLTIEAVKKLRQASPFFQKAAFERKNRKGI